MIAPRRASFLVVGLGGMLGGLALGWTLWRPREVVETPLPEVRQADSSLVLERRPDPRARPAHRIPRGAVVERVATVTVQPTVNIHGAENIHTPVDVSGAVDKAVAESPPCTCVPVHVDLSLVRLGDGTRRVIASARGGTVIGGVDVPVESATPRRVQRWAAGGAWDPQARRWGGFIDRDLDRVAFVPLPLRVGVSVVPTPGGATYGVRVGLRF